MLHLSLFSFFFFFNDTATTEIYTLSLHDALPIFMLAPEPSLDGKYTIWGTVVSGMDNIDKIKKGDPARNGSVTDRKSTRLNSSHGYISYAVFCLKKKKKEKY